MYAYPLTYVTSFSYTKLSFSSISAYVMANNLDNKEVNKRTGSLYPNLDPEFEALSREKSAGMAGRDQTRRITFGRVVPITEGQEDVHPGPPPPPRKEDTSDPREKVVPRRGPLPRDPLHVPPTGPPGGGLYDRDGYLLPIMPKSGATPARMPPRTQVASTSQVPRAPGAVPVPRAPVPRAPRIYEEIDPPSVTSSTTSRTTSSTTSTTTSSSTSTTTSSTTSRATSSASAGTSPADQDQKPFEHPSVKDYLAVAAIDFGTTYSGYAFSMAAHPKKIFMSKAWGGEHSQASLKTGTSLLLDYNFQVVEFGDQAEKTYRESEDNGASDLHLFMHFKMKLHKLRNIDTNASVSSVNGKKCCTAFSLIVKSLAHMKKLLLEQLCTAGQKQVTNDDILWVITVPAIWSDTSKTLMRRAAHQAKLIHQERSKQLMIALEPEAAALYCRSEGSDDYMRPVPVGAEYVVVDVGGGTADIAVQEALPMGHSNEVYYPTGGDWGGLQVNTKLTALLTKVLGEDFIQHFMTTCPAGWLSLLQNFETKKRGVKRDSALKLDMSHILASEYQDFKHEKIDNAFKRSAANGITLSSGYIVFNKEVVASVFDSCIQKILNHLDDLLQKPELKRVKYMMLVGGFSESPLLQEAFHSRFDEQLDIIIPHSTSLAVVKGAVLFGHNPKTIESRCISQTYGTSYIARFDPAKHDKKRLEIIDGEDCCVGCFQPFVLKGMTVKNGETREMSYQPAHSGATSLSFGLYASETKNPTYIDDPGVTLVKHLRVRMPDVTKGKDREVKVIITFGETEISVTAEDMSVTGGDACRESFELVQTL